MGCAFLMGATGIENDDTVTNSASHMKSWLTALENDVKLVVTAASAAQKAADFILGVTA